MRGEQLSIFKEQQTLRVVDSALHLGVLGKKHAIGEYKLAHVFIMNTSLDNEPLESKRGDNRQKVHQ